MDGNDRVPLVLGHVEENPVSEDASVVDLHVQASSRPMHPAAPVTMQTLP